MAISVAFFGLGIGSLFVHINNKRSQNFLPQILQSTITFAISVPIFLVVIGYVIPPNTSSIYLFYLASAIPFFFAGVSMAEIYLAMPKEISKLYFVDLVGAAVATLVLDPLMQRIGAESVLLLITPLVIGPSLITTFVLFVLPQKNVRNIYVIKNSIKIYGVIMIVASILLLAYNINFNLLAIQPGESKGLHYQLANPSTYKHLSTQWNSFSRIDVTKQIHYNNNNSDVSGRSRTAASIIIDADADTPVFKWNGSSEDMNWLKNYMDFMPYEMLKTNDTLVIGSGGGEDVLIALAGGSKKITAVELNSLVASVAKQFGNSSGNLYQRENIKLLIDDGRRFISSTHSKYDIIMIKLVDSWAAQLAGGYALSENYLYTVEAFKQYMQHLNDNGMLVMVRWNIELPRLMPLVVESLRQQQTEKNIKNISQQVLVVEDRPGLYFESNNQRTIFPVLVIVKNSPFVKSEIALAKEHAAKNGAKIIVMPNGYVQPPYDRLLLNGIDHLQSENDSKTDLIKLRPPTDDSPFYFARELIPHQMVILLETVVGVSIVLTLLLIFYSRRNKNWLNVSTLRFYIPFTAFIGFGFMFLEITFIQKFLLLLRTPIMALTVILFSVLLSSGIGAYLSGKLFNRNPYKAIAVSIPLLVMILFIYYGYLQKIIDFNMFLSLYHRIALTVALISPAGLLMGFQFPSITRMTSMHISEKYNSITLLWGINVIASVVGTVLTAVLSMMIGFGGNILVGIGLYLGALASATAAVKMTYMGRSEKIIK